MSVTIEDFCVIADRAEALGFIYPTSGIAILPRNFDTTGEVSEILEDDSTATIRKLFHQKPGHEPVTQADFTYSITADTITITDTGKGRVSVANDIVAVLRKIEYWHQGSIAGFKIPCSDDKGVWHSVRWDGQRGSIAQ